MNLTLTDDLTVNRMGFGAMQLPGPRVFGPPRDHAEALAVLREAVELGVDVIDTADFYGPTVANELIKEALHPYPDGLRIMTKVGARRGDDASWHPSLAPADLRTQVHENLSHLGLDVLDVVYLRMSSNGGTEPIAEQFGTLVELRDQGLIRHLGLSGASTSQLGEAQAMAPVVAVQNRYNLADRQDQPMLDRCAKENIAYVPYFPLGGFRPLQSAALDQVAARLELSRQQVALAWLLRRSPTVVLIPGTSSVAHLRENMASADLELPADAIAELDALA